MNTCETKDESDDDDKECRATCATCDFTDNIEEGADCRKCRHWICAECVSFGDDGNYYCAECLPKQ